MLSDMITPVGAYRKLRDHFPNTLLLESADYHDRSDSKSFICLDPIAGFEATANEYNLQNLDGRKTTHTVESAGDVFEALNTFVKQHHIEKVDLPFNVSGFFGYTSFEAVQYMEDITLSNPRLKNKSNPDLKYNLFRFVLVFDHFKNELYVVQHIIQDGDDNRIDEIMDLLKVGHSPEFTFQTDGTEYSSISDKDYKSMIERGVKHCQRGDVFQIVLSREFNQPYKGDDFQVYRALRSVNPSPYLFYFDYGSFRIFGSSPESQLQVHEGRAEINPIAGTVRRGANTAEDASRAQALQDDPKEQAEHVMLVDLARNDLSKHADKISVETYAEIQYFSHVIHMVSKVIGELEPNSSGMDIYADTFPAGTLSGAPKYRALQLIDEIEHHSRNFYGGAIGFFGTDGSVNHAIIIRSMLSKLNTLTYQAGAGVVVDSTPEGELQEVFNKIAALREAIKKATSI